MLMSITTHELISFITSFFLTPERSLTRLLFGGGYTDLSYMLMEQASQVTPPQAPSGPTEKASSPQTPPQTRDYLLFCLLCIVAVAAAYYRKNGDTPNTPSPKGLHVDTSIPMRSSTFTSTTPTGTTLPTGDTPLPPAPPIARTFPGDPSNIVQAQTTRLPTPSADTSGSSVTFDSSDSD